MLTDFLQIIRNAKGLQRFLSLLQFRQLLVIGKQYALCNAHDLLPSPIRQLYITIKLVLYNFNQCHDFFLN